MLLRAVANIAVHGAEKSESITAQIFTGILVYNTPELFAEEISHVVTQRGFMNLIPDEKHSEYASKVISFTWVHQSIQ